MGITELLGIIKDLVLPPGGPLLLLFLAMLVLKRWPGLARAMMVVAILGMWLLSSPVVSTRLMSGLERIQPSEPAEWIQAQAVVVLSGGRYYGAPELQGRDRINGETLSRLDEGVRVARNAELPILLTGGKVSSSDDGTLAELMQRSLIDEFDYPARWLENRSENTQQNALFTREMLEQDDINKIVLVTSAWHMPRAMRNFQNQGFRTIIPAPVGYTTVSGLGIDAWIPNSSALTQSRWALHEWIGWLVGR